MRFWQTNGMLVSTQRNQEQCSKGGCRRRVGGKLSGMLTAFFHAGDTSHFPNICYFFKETANSGAALMKRNLEAGSRRKRAYHEDQILSSTRNKLRMQKKYVYLV